MDNFGATNAIHYKALLVLNVADGGPRQETDIVNRRNTESQAEILFTY